MLIGKVQGRLVATIKNEKLQGYSFVIVQRLGKSGRLVGYPFVAVDSIGCGTGDTVLVTQGENSGFALCKTDIPVDAVIIGVVDTYDMGK